MALTPTTEWPTDIEITTQPEQNEMQKIIKILGTGENSLTPTDLATVKPLVFDRFIKNKLNCQNCNIDPEIGTVTVAPNPQQPGIFVCYCGLFCSKCSHTKNAAFAYYAPQM